MNRATIGQGLKWAKPLEERLMGKKAIKNSHLNSLTNPGITKTRTPRGTGPAEKTWYKRHGPSPSSIFLRKR